MTVVLGYFFCALSAMHFLKMQNYGWALFMTLLCLWDLSLFILIACGKPPLL